MLRSAGRVGIASVYRVLEGLDGARPRSAGRPRRWDRPLRARSTRGATIITISSAATAARWSRSRTPALEQALERVAGELGYAMDEHEVVLHGACGDCRS